MKEVHWQSMSSRGRGCIRCTGNPVTYLSFFAAVVRRACNRFLREKRDIFDVRLATYTQALSGDLLRLISVSGGSFSDLEPVAQALVQAAAQQMVYSAGPCVRLPAALEVLTTVPLLHGACYDCLLDELLKGTAHPAMPCH